MSNTSTLMSGIKARVQAALGVSYSPLTHVLSLDKNSFTDADKRWGVVPGPSDEVSGNVGNNTMEQSFRVFITDSYITSEYGDSEIVDKIVAMVGLSETVYKDLVNTKCGAPSVVRLVSGMSVNDSLIWEEEKIIVCEFGFRVRSQVSLN
jgi:hypothetical protein